MGRRHLPAAYHLNEISRLAAIVAGGDTDTKCQLHAGIRCTAYRFQSYNLYGYIVR
jgi:hypothetical protein